MKTIKEINKKFDENFELADCATRLKLLDSSKLKGDNIMIIIKDFYTQQILSLIEELIPKYNKYDAEKDLDKWYGFQEAIDQMRAVLREFFEIKD